MKPRSSLSQTGGAIETAGDPAIATHLADAWRAARGPGRELTHGFHAYPARSHPGVVRALIAAFSEPGDVVVDPFCGSGTTLVEAFAAGRRALGSDVNAVAVRLARLKTRRMRAADLAEFVEAAERIGRRGRGAMQQREGEPAPALVREWFEPHVWRELDVLGRAIDEVRSPERHGALLLVLSSLLTKVSRRRAETSEDAVEKSVARGFPSRWFLERARELADGLAALAAAAATAAAAAPVRTPEPVVALADARASPFATKCARLVVTSPPYLGTYDYSAIQELRGRLLGISLAAAGKREIGRRVGAGASTRASAGAAPEREVADFERDLAASLREIGRVLGTSVSRKGAPEPAGALAVLILGDSVAGPLRGRERARVPVRADELVSRSAKSAGLSVVARASQARESSPSPRREHLIALRVL